MQYHHSFKNSKVFEPKGNFLSFQVNINSGKLGEATGAMARLVFWSRGLKKSLKVLKSKSRSLEVAPVVSTFIQRRWLILILN